MTYELLTGVQFDPSRPLEELFNESLPGPQPHPMLKYFLGRLWQVKRHHPAYPGYENMLHDLERIRNRITAQGGTGNRKRDAGPKTGSKSRSLLDRTLALLARGTTIVVARARGG